MIIVDSTVWIDLLNDSATPETTWLRQQAGKRPIGLTDLILCEVLQGIRSDTLFTETQRRLRSFTLFSNGGDGIAIAAAVNYRHLRARGFTVRKTIDCLIATFCLANDHTLLHRDRDFDLFERELGLQVLHP